jgi:hypothetical protein
VIGSEVAGHGADGVHEIARQVFRFAGPDGGELVQQLGEQCSQLGFGDLAAEAEGVPPPPKPTCWLGFRLKSNFSGSVNTSVSQLPEA